QQLWEARNLPAPYVKKFYTPAVCERRPESGTWQSVAMETAAMGGLQGPMTDSGPGRQQHEEAVYRGLWQIRGLAAAMGARNLPAPYVKKFYTPAVCEET
ncbi:unnamed protein product, partial [Staurois parvus]